VADKDRLDRAGDRVAQIVERILALGLICAIVLDFINVVGRYFSGFTILGVDEIEIYVLIWIAFIGAAVVTWRREHLRMDVLLHALPAPARDFIARLEMVVMFVAATFVAYQALLYVDKMFTLGAVSDILGIPTWIPHTAVFLSFFAIALIVLVRAAQRWTPLGAAGRRDQP
jgi:TRAP-type C4-dicarboxylate transport system permease small subunit